MLNDIEIPTMFKRDPITHRVIPEMSEGCEWAKDRTDTLLTIKLDGELVKIWWDVPLQTKCVGRKLGDIWFKMSGDHPSDKYIWEAYANSSTGFALPEGYYVAFGPNINDNKQGVDRLQMIRIAPVDAQLIIGWGAVDIMRGSISVEEFYNNLKKELEESTIEGFVFQWEKPQMVPFKFAKITRKDFGFDWPIKEIPQFLTPSELVAINDPFTYVGD